MLRMTDPKKYNEITQIMQTNANPQDYLMKYMNEFSNERIQRVFIRAK